MQINEISDAERERMREKLKPVITKHSATLGEPLVSEFFAEIDKQRKAPPKKS